MLVMCDWVTGTIETGPRWADSHPVWDSGKMQVLEPGASLPSRMWPRRAVAEGSYSNKITWMSRTGYDLEVSGNPAKFLQGHNLFGPGDPRGLFFETGLELRRRGVPFPSPASYSSNDCRTRLTRVDFTRSYRFASDEHARAWLQMAGAYSRSRAGGAVMREGTLYFGDGSSYWSMKVYLKSDEVRSGRRGHGLSSGLSDSERALLLAWADGVVRFEVTLHSRVLSGLPADFLDESALWNEYFRRVDFMGVSTSTTDYLNDPRVAELPTVAQMALRLWAAGDQAALQSIPRKTMYRYRKAIRELFGVDIAVPRPAENVKAVDVGLDPAGWDPEPIQGLYHRVDPVVRSAYKDGKGLGIPKR